jgi:hypothetical protein
MRTTLVHSGNSGSLSSLASPHSQGDLDGKISGNPKTEYDFTPQVKHEQTGWLRHKFR